jgi:PAS domain S-box-containing protein
MATDIIESSAFLSAIVESSNDAIVGKSLEGTILSWNAAAEKLYGYSAQETVGQNISLIIPPERSTELKEILSRIIRGERVESFETVRVGKDGTRIEVSLTISPIKDSSGRILGASTISRDITERRTAERERAELLHRLEEQRRRLSDIVRNVPGVVWEAWGEPDEAGQRINFVSDYVEKMLGYTVDEWLSTPNFWLNIVHPEDRERAAREARVKFLSEEGGTSRFRWLRKDGRALWVEAHSAPIKDHEGRPVGMCGVTMDITGRKLAEDALRESEERYKSLLENANDIIYSHDLEGNYLAINRAGELATGYTREEILGGLNISQTIAPEHRERARQMTEQKLRDPSPTVYELDIISKDGRRLTLEVSTRLFYEGGKPVAVEGVARDVTERKRAEDEQARLREEIIRAQESLLVELSTPLIPIKKGIVAMPLIGAMNAERASQMISALLEGVRERCPHTAIIDITGVPTVDTQVASALIDAASAVELMGTEVIITGIRGRVAQTLIGLGVDLGTIVTRRNLQSGIEYAERSR